MWLPCEIPCHPARADDARLGGAQPQHVAQREGEQDGQDGEDGQSGEAAVRHGDQGRAKNVATPPPTNCESCLRNPRVLVVIGVAGSGKTTVGRALAARLGWAFEDADDHHSAHALATMARGIGLTDADRAPWLARLAALVGQRAAEGPPTVLACSALKARYREALRAGRADVQFAWLDVPEPVLAQRLADRRGHVAGPALLPSQLGAFEPPQGALRLDGERPVAEVVEQAARRLAR